ncbi:MAG: lipopolysaccharide biosynthesis protein [Spirochaetaceae bacterium]|jgi:O-antigen/teichoic acid export membrane protein|nr:lipopolysaccharide biosynthesis protein [Spirochaetaceae bacterium]
MDTAAGIIVLKLSSKLNTRFNQNVFYNSLGSFTYIFFQYLLTVVILRVKGAEDAGVYSLAYTFTNIFATIATFGMGNYQISDVMGRHTDGTYIATRVCTSAAALVCFFITLFFTGFPRGTLVCCAVLMLYRLLEGLSGVYLCVLQKFEDYKTISVSYCIKGGLTFLTFCATLYFFELQQAIFAMSAAFLPVFLLFDIPRAVHSAGFTAKAVKRDIANILFPSFVLVLQSLSYFCMTFFTRYIIEKTYSTKELGYFSSITLIMLVLPLLTGPALSVLIPGFSGLYAQKRYAVIRRMTFRACVCVAVVTAALCASSLLWGRFALRLLFGEEILQYSFLLMPTLLAGGFLLGCGMLAGILTAMRRHGSLLTAGIAAALTVVLCCPALVRRFYMGGAIYSLIIAYTVQGIITMAVIIRNIKDVSAVTDNEI